MGWGLGYPKMRVFGLTESHSLCLLKDKNASVPIKEILDTAGWSSERTFDRFYNKPLQKNGSFAPTVLNID